MNAFINLETKKTLTLYGVKAPVVDTKEAKLYPTQDLLKKYFTKYNFYAEFFGEDIIMQALTRGPYGLDYFARHEIMYPAMAQYYLSNGCLLADENRRRYRRTEYNGTWRREVDEIGYDVWLPKSYDFQSEMFIKEIFELVYPWMIPFRPHLKLYTPNSENDYIFLETGDNKIGPFYIQLKHLKNLDIQGLVNAHMDYHDRYYHWPGGWGESVTEADVTGWRETHQSAAWQDVTLRFLGYVELERLYRDNGRTDKIYY